MPLTAGEFDLLRVFAQHPNRVLTRDQLIELVKGREWAAYDRAIDTQVGRLRKKLEADPANPSLIKTVRGGGYVFATPVKPAEAEARSAVQHLAQLGLELARCCRACRAKRRFSAIDSPLLATAGSA